MSTASTATRREIWLAATILLVIAGSLMVRRDVLPFSNAGPARTGKPGVTPLAPDAPDDVNVLLTNTPLAIAPSDALTLNAERPLDKIPTSFAKPFFLPASTAGDQGIRSNAALECMTQAIYYEAASESDTGKRAVAQVVLNRLRSPIFPHTVCGVVYQGSEQRTGCQFSFTCDGSLARKPGLGGWMQARRIALSALSGSVERSVGLSTHYHANYVVPYWANSLDKVATIGAHIFYTMRGSLGRPPGFGARYAATAEGIPTVLPNGEGDEALSALLGGNVIADPANLVAPNRTVVKDDMLGKPARPDLAPLAPKPALRADESRGELVIDQKTGGLGNTR